MKERCENLNLIDVDVKKLWKYTSKEFYKKLKKFGFSKHVDSFTVKEYEPFFYDGDRKKSHPYIRFWGDIILDNKKMEFGVQLSFNGSVSAQIYDKRIKEYFLVNRNGFERYLSFVEREKNHRELPSFKHTWQVDDSYMY